MIDEDCHEASKYAPHTLARDLAAYLRYDAEAQTRSTKAYPGAPETPLPAPGRLGTPLGRVLRRRRSRPVNGTPGLRDLATLFWAAQGLEGGQRTAPSAGGLHPIEIYVHAQGVRGLVDGIHHLDPHRWLLEHVRPIGGAWALDDVHDTSCRIVLTADLERVRGKYGARAYRFALLEAGHACQNLLLAATGLGLDAVPVGGFFDDRVHDDLGIDGVQEVALYVVPVGPA